jgi:hypothetical protein
MHTVLSSQQHSFFNITPGVKEPPSHGHIEYVQCLMCTWENETGGWYKENFRNVLEKRPPFRVQGNFLLK